MVEKQNENRKLINRNRKLIKTEYIIITNRKKQTKRKAENRGRESAKEKSRVS